MGIQKAILSAKKKKKKKKPFAAIEVETVNSDKWLELNKAEAHVYNTLKTFYRGEEAIFKAPFSIIEKRSRIKHGDTIDRALEGLESKEWIEVQRYAKHGKRRGLRVRANEYTLTFKWDKKRW